MLELGAVVGSGGVQSGVFYELYNRREERVELVRRQDAALFVELTDDR